MAPASAENRELAAMVATAFGHARPHVRRYWDDAESHHIDIAQVTDSPAPGTTSHGTLGLSDYPLIENGAEYPVRCELVGTCASAFDFFPNILATSAFNIMTRQWFAAPGRIFPDVVAMYYPSFHVRHVMFCDPFPWDEDLTTAEFPAKTVAWLLAVPVTEAERDYALSSGPHALVEVFVREQMDLFDLKRPSVV
jgi:antitoxin YqcF